jgi:molybdenum-dependent DNA-binding transcriptional regulator ModE
MLTLKNLNDVLRSCRIEVRKVDGRWFTVGTTKGSELCESYPDLQAAVNGALSHAGNETAVKLEKLQAKVSEGFNVRLSVQIAGLEKQLELLGQIAQFASASDIAE